jgi:hypothetical protein
MHPIATPARIQGAVLLLVLRAWLPGVATAASSQSVVPHRAPVRSQSGQFLVFPTRSQDGGATARAKPDTLRLEAPLLTISCERIKQTLGRELALSRPWRGKIFVTLYPATDSVDRITITSERFNDGWQYRVELPDQLERGRYVRLIVQVLLLEIANREASHRSAEIPLWLIEGFAERLLSSTDIDLLLPAQRPAADGVAFSLMNVTARRENPLENAHLALCSGAALTFEQLSWPADDQAGEAGAAVLRSSAQVFVHELLRLKDGQACLQAMLAQLPEHYNWQFAFLRAFHRWFPTTLDVEKWWALRLVHFTGRELAQTWPLEESWEKLNQLVHPSVQLRVGTNELPLHTEVTLQMVIRQWDRANQTQTLQAKARELKAMRLRLAEDLAPLVDDYRLAIESYLDQRDKGLPWLKKRAQNRVVAETLQRLDQLDDRLLMLRPGPKRVASRAGANE